MDGLICPDIFNGNIKAYFTKKSFGMDKRKISSVMYFKEKDIFFPIQKHTDKVAIINTDLTSVIADAVITDRKGISIGVQTADCIPMLLFDAKKYIIGAVHSGWRGTSKQIIKKTISIMVNHFRSSPENIYLALGPSIKGSCYCVDFEVMDAIYKATGNGEYILRKDGKYYIDLSTANIIQAKSLGVPDENIWNSPLCTFCNPEEFYSYRYSGDYRGSQGGFIGIY